jgi:hypothetical protein
MRYQQDLQAAIRKRYKRLKATGSHDIHTEFRLVTSWISRQPTLCAILAEAEQAEPWLDFEQWAKRIQENYAEPIWPCRTEAGRASLAWQLMQRVAATRPSGRTDHYGVPVNPVQEYARGLSYGSGNPQPFVRRIVGPLVDYLIEQVGGETAVLYALERYARRVEWFDREELHARYQQDTRNGEKIYDKDLRRFLFAEGISMPFSQPQSASGLSDVLADLDTDDPLVCELKIFDGDSRGKQHLAAGVNQVVHYATDYGKAAAYLVIINLSGRQLELPSDGPAEIWPPNVELARVRVYLIAVRALPGTTASKQGRAIPVTITRADLIDTDTIDPSHGDN